MSCAPSIHGEGKHLNLDGVGVGVRVKWDRFGMR